MSDTFDIIVLLWLDEHENDPDRTIADWCAAWPDPTEYFDYELAKARDTAVLAAGSHHDVRLYYRSVNGWLLAGI